MSITSEQKLGHKAARSMEDLDWVFQDEIENIITEKTFPSILDVLEI